MIYKVKDSFLLTIFGASGDLAKLKLFPAIYSLAEQKRLPEKFFIVGFARSEITQADFQQQFTDSIKKKHPDANPKILEALAKNVHYFSGQYDDLGSFEEYQEFLTKLTKTKKITNLNYFSVPPSIFEGIIKNLGETQKMRKDDIRIILEKPFGENTQTAQQLFHFVARYFKEDQVYLLDHYLGKSAVQSILHLRHSNRILNLIMKGPSVANIQLTAHEDIGVTTRAGYFDKVGTIKDMVQSHLLQILALITMSIPITESSESLHREKYSILSALKFIEDKKNIVIGQYKSYKKEKDVPKDSSTETYAALQLFIDRESWYRVPIYLRTGKKLNQKKTSVVIEIKKFNFQSKDEEPNRIIIELQPKEKITIKLINKHGSKTTYQEIESDASIACTGDDCLPEHSLLLLDVIKKKKMHFLSFQEIIATWSLTDKIMHFIKEQKIKPEIYNDGSSGPKSADQLTKNDKFKWYETD